MHKWLAYSAISLSACLFASHSALATESQSMNVEQQAWYVSQGEEYLVQEQRHGALYALLTTSVEDDIGVYLFFNDADCRGDDGQVLSHEPLYINDQLVRFSQYCDAPRRYLVPTTANGRYFLIDEFVKRRSVDISSADHRFTATFSAMGFADFYRQFQQRFDAM
uniref:hypothetical protein n=1 Tax=Thaumasiovibrio occultus TaxID=1891184 RepID=UPI000B35334A|nr:hypothetical protein [Thaumasiovibrio occultus]